MGANAEVVRSGWEAFARQDLAAATENMDDGAEIVVPETLPWGGTYHGPDGFKEMIGSFTSQLEEFRLRPRPFLRRTTTT